VATLIVNNRIAWQQAVHADPLVPQERLSPIKTRAKIAVSLATIVRRAPHKAKPRLPVPRDGILSKPVFIPKNSVWNAQWAHIQAYQPPLKIAIFVGQIHIKI
jgi:hypothetical protein